MNDLDRSIGEYKGESYEVLYDELLKKYIYAYPYTTNATKAEGENLIKELNNG